MSRTAEATTVWSGALEVGTRAIDPPSNDKGRDSALLLETSRVNAKRRALTFRQPYRLNGPYRL